MRRIVFALLLTAIVVNFSVAAETSFRTIKVADANGKLTKAVLTFNDQNKAMEVRPAKGDPVIIPYGRIDKCSYEYTQELTAAMTESKAHWLEVDYHEQEAHKVLVLRMDKSDYVRILEALKKHAGVDTELLGNADKRRGNIWRARQ